jgi:hypothetical protein
MSKKVFICFFVLLSTLGYSQSKIANQNTKIEAFSIEVSVNSAEEIETALSPKNLEAFFKLIEADEGMTFKLNCSFNETKDKLKGDMTYTVKGKGSDKKQFVKNVEKAKTTALKFFNLKNRNK